MGIAKLSGLSPNLNVCVDMNITMGISKNSVAYARANAIVSVLIMKMGLDRRSVLIIVIIMVIVKNGGATNKRLSIVLLGK